MTLKNVLSLSAAFVALTLAGCGDLGKKKEGEAAGEEHKTEAAAPAGEENKGDEHKTEAAAPAEEHKADAAPAEEHKADAAAPAEEHKADAAAPAAEEKH